MCYLRGISVLKLKEKKKKKVLQKRKESNSKIVCHLAVIKSKTNEKGNSRGLCTVNRRKGAALNCHPQVFLFCHVSYRALTLLNFSVVLPDIYRKPWGEARLSALHSGISFESRHSRGTQNFHGSNQLNPRCESSCSSSHSRHVPIFSWERQLRDKKMIVIH